MAEIIELVPPPPRKVLGDEIYVSCFVCDIPFKGEPDSWGECPNCTGRVEYFPPTPPMSSSMFRMACRRNSIDVDVAKRLFDINLDDYPAWPEPSVPVPEEVVRKMVAVDSRPWGVPLFNSATAPKGPNTKYSVRTPKGDFPTVNAAAEAYGISAQTAYTRASRGYPGWSKILIKGGNMSMKSLRAAAEEPEGGEPGAESEDET